MFKVCLTEMSVHPRILPPFLNPHERYLSLNKNVTNGHFGEGQVSLAVIGITNQ